MESDLRKGADNEVKYEDPKENERNMGIAFAQVVVVIALFFFGVFEIMIGFQGSAENRRLKRVCTQAMTGIKTSEEYTSKKGLRGTENYCDHIYTYEFEGREYTAVWRISDTQTVPADIIDLFIDPQDPSEYRIIGNERQPKENYIKGTVIMVVMVVVDILFRLIDKRSRNSAKRKKTNEREE